VDISLPGESGLTLIQQLRAEPRPPIVLALSVHDETLYAPRAVRHGASGYVCKSAPVEDLLQAMRSVLAGRVYVSHSVNQGIVRPGPTGVDSRSPRVDALSDRELEVFRLIGEGNGTRQIAVQLHIRQKTVETYRENIKRKLGIANATALVRLATSWSLDSSGQRP
jgi:DNA-binding NarL/FixJ family response regulator